MAPFDVGDVVVCVDARAHDSCQETCLKQGAFYRVSAVGATRSGRPSIDVGIPENDGGISWFIVQRFRKIDADVTEEFRETLRKLPAPEPSNA